MEGLEAGTLVIQNEIKPFICLLLQPTLCKGEVCRGSYIAQCAQYPEAQNKEANKEEAEKFLRDFYTIHDRQEITSQNTTLIQYFESKVKCDSII